MTATVTDITGVLNVAAFGTVTSKGPVRSTNEDAVLVESKRSLFGVADGFGGVGIGDEAAKKALEDVRHFVEHGLGDSEVTLPFIYRSYLSASANLIFNSFLYANEELLRANGEKHINSRGGASALFAFFEGRNLTLANVGGCSAFLVRRGRVQQIVRPRTFNSLKGQFMGSWNAKWAFPLMALGQSRDLEPEILELKTESGDQILLMTDGAYGCLTESDFAECFQLFTQEKAKDLGIEVLQNRIVEIANQRGNTDNLSLISICCA